MAQHLFTCPHCSKPSIGIWVKYWARPFNPAVCQYCDKASSLSDGVETASAWLYFIAGIWAFMVLALGAARVHNCSFIDCGTPDPGPSPVSLLISLMVFYVAVEMAKVFWIPLTAISDTEVEKRKSTSNRIVTAVVIFFLAALLLEKCGF